MKGLPHPERGWSLFYISPSGPIALERGKVMIWLT